MLIVFQQFLLTFFSNQVQTTLNRPLGAAKTLGKFRV
jgi:hypothetical protein